MVGDLTRLRLAVRSTPQADNIAMDMWTTPKKRCPHAHSDNHNSTQFIKIRKNHPHDYAMKRSFQIEAPSTVAGASKPTAHVAFAAKILGDKGHFVASHTFDVQITASDTSAAGATTSLGDAFGQAVTQLSEWIAAAI
jgi:ABC-type uncharacterized transport system auxiliary subunit